MACVLSDQHVHDLDVGRQSTVGKQEKEVQARPPTGESSSRSTFDRAIFQASPDELPVIDIHSL